LACWGLAWIDVCLIDIGLIEIGLIEIVLTEIGLDRDIWPDGKWYAKVLLCNYCGTMPDGT
jgi:hypothetical protein